MLAAYAFILLLALAALVVSAGPLIATRLLGPSVKYDEKLSTYECGIDAVGGVETRVNIRFYIYALIFVIFDVEALYVLPWAVGAKEIRALGAGVDPLLEMLVFLAILFIGLIYAWRKGALVWE